MDGLTALRKIRERRPDLPVIVITAHGTMQTAVEAIKSGAFEYITKPVDLAEAESASRAAGALRAAAKRLDEAAAARHAESEERAGRGRARWERAMTLVRPRGLPQERVLATVAVAARYGAADLAAGLRALDLHAPGHQVVHVD